MQPGSPPPGLPNSEQVSRDNRVSTGEELVKERRRDGQTRYEQAGCDQVTPTTTKPPTASLLEPAQLIQEHQAGVWRYLRALGCEPALADDLTQETFLAVLQRPFQDFGPAAAAAYLRRIAFNLHITHHRRAGKITPLDNIEEIDAAWSKFAENDQGESLLAALKHCLSQLTDRARAALEMRFRDSRTRDDIASMLKITEHGAKNLMQRAKQQLRVCIEAKLQSDF